MSNHETPDKLDQPLSTAQPTPGTSFWSSQSPTWVGLLAVATSVLLMAGIAFQQIRFARQHNDLLKAADDVATLRKQTDQLQTAAADLKRQLDSTAELARLWQTKNVRLVSLAGAAETQPQAFGQILWDEQHREWHVFIAGMKPAGEGKAYELWFVTKDEKKVPAGLFEPDEAGRARLTIGVPDNLGPLALAAVTDEPKAGSPQPTGSFQLVGKIN